MSVVEFECLSGDKFIRFASGDEVNPTVLACWRYDPLGAGRSLCTVAINDHADSVRLKEMLSGVNDNNFFQECDQGVSSADEETIKTLLVHRTDSGVLDFSFILDINDDSYFESVTLTQVQADVMAGLIKGNSEPMIPIFGLLG